MAESEKPGNSSNINEEALLHAWAQLSVYDRTATTLKQQYILRRRAVVIMTLIATIASVLTGIAGNESLALILAITAVVMPIFAAAIMNDVVQFIGTSDWVRNRFIAETIRMHIFLYRMHAGIYGEGENWQADDHLGEQISKVIKENRTPNDVPLKTTLPQKKNKIVAAIKRANRLTEKDKGLSEPSIEEYVEWRLDEQRHWYERRINNDFRRFKFFFRIAQIFLLLGMLIGLLAGAVDETELVTLVAITNSISASITLWSDLGLVGKTYGLFMVAANQLIAQKGQWIAMQNNPDYLDPQTKTTKYRSFVKTIEDILEWERLEWRELVLQSQLATDKIILGNLERLTARAEKAQEVRSPDGNE